MERLTAEGSDREGGLPLTRLSESTTVRFAGRPGQRRQARVETERLVGASFFAHTARIAAR